MRHIILRTGIATLVLSALAVTAPGQSGVGTLEVTGARARFARSSRTGASRHMLKLTLRVSPRSLIDAHVAADHALRVAVDGTALCDAESAAGGLRTRKRGRWIYRGVVAGGHVRIKADGRSGKVKVKVTRAALPALEASPAVDLPVTLELAGGVVETDASFWVDDRRVRRWRGLSYGFPPGPGPGPGTDPDPDPDPDLPHTGVITREMLLADMKRRGVESFMSGSREPSGGFDRQTLRCPSGQLAEVIVLAAPLPGSVDMFSDTAYVCRHSGKYWAHRSGGFAGFYLWIGPFDLP
jgi:hypothetical protein